MEDETFPAIVTDFKNTYIVQESKRKINSWEVWVKVESAAINPNDYMLTMGYYSVSTVPIGVGFEGSGLIVEVGSEVDQNLLGKKVAFLQQPDLPDYSGTWRQYIYVHMDSLAVYPDDLDFDSIATISINPPTVCGFIDITLK